MTLSAASVAVHFGGLSALAGVDLDVERGQVSALIGPNGAGKTTLFNCFSGFVKVSEGSISLDGTEITRARVDRRIHLGLARSFQTPRLDPDATVFDSVLSGYYPQSHARLARTILHTRSWAREEATLRARCSESLDAFGFGHVAHERAGDLPLGQMRILELARAMALSPTYLLLDEPAAGLDADERLLLAQRVRDLAAADVGVLLVEHNFSFVREIADEVTVLVRGRVIGSGPPHVVEHDDAVIDAYLGVPA